jgi:pumilio RNA-binding family
MVRDQYGNYVIQYVLDLKDMNVNGRIVDKLKGIVMELSNEKFSSNVIEKVLHHIIHSV